MDLRCLWCSSISCLVQMNFTRPPDGWGLSEISINPFAWPWDHSITEPPLKKRRFCLFFNAKLMTLTQEALAAADRHQAGQSSATAAFCLWKVNCFLVASIVERLQRRHFEHKWHYSNSRNLRRLFWKFYLDKNHPSKTTYNTIIILYNIQAICRFASQRVNWRNCKLFSFQGLQASSKVSCSSAGRDRSTSGPFRAEAQGIPANWAVFKCSKFCESRNRRKGILSKRCWTQNDFAYFHLYYLYLSMSYIHLVVRMFTSGDPTSVALKLSPQKCEQRASHRALPTPSETGVILCHSAAMGIQSQNIEWNIPFSGFQSQNISHLKQDCDTHLQSFFHIFIIRLSCVCHTHHGEPWIYHLSGGIKLVQKELCGCALLFP